MWACFISDQTVPLNFSPEPRKEHLNAKNIARFEEVLQEKEAKSCGNQEFGRQQ